MRIRARRKLHVRLLRNSSLQLSAIFLSHSSRDASVAAQDKPVHVVYTDYSRSKGQSIWNSVNILSDLYLK